MSEGLTPGPPPVVGSLHTSLGTFQNRLIDGLHMPTMYLPEDLGVLYSV